MNQIETVSHEFEPVFDVHSTVLVLGTMPSPKSREQGFYYGHPRNRFWQVMAEVLREPVPAAVPEKKAMLLRHGVAVWDVLKSCDIRGADDGSIRNPVANDMGRIFNHADIRAVFTTGGKAAALYKRYCLPETGMPAAALPSTSPANCGMSYKTMLNRYLEIRKYLTETLFYVNRF